MLPMCPDNFVTHVPGLCRRQPCGGVLSSAAMMSRGSAGTGGTVRSSREISETDVIEIKTSPTTASARGAVVEAAIGFGLGPLSGEVIAHSRSGNPGLVVVALIGFPIEWAATPDLAASETSRQR